MNDSSAIQWTIACQAPLSMGFPRQEHWSGLLFPSPGHLPDPGIEPVRPPWQEDSLPLSHQGSPHIHTTVYKIDKQGPIVYKKLLSCNNL